MNAHNDKLDSADGASPIDKWVLESCFLDLLVDEEEPEDIEGWALDQGWSIPFTSARERIQKVRPTDKDTCWPFADSVLKSELKEFDDPSRVKEWFLNMKAARAWASLDCNRIRYEYAQLPSETGRQSVRKAFTVVRNTLNAIILDSLAAFGSIPRNPETLKEEWSVLVALFHSEVCASGTTADVSFGMARAFDAFFPPELGLPWRRLFQLVSTHNQGRGLNHQHNPVECIRLLEPLLEGFNSKVEEAKKYLPLAVRLVFFPAVFTLSDALQDCHRTTEAAWWIRSAWNRQPSDYWKSRLDVELSIFGEERKDPLPKKNTKPKLMNQEQRVKYLEIERQISEGQQIDDLGDCTSKWAEALAWTIRWHEGDHVNLPGTIQGAAQSVQTVSAALKERLRKPGKDRKIPPETYEKCLGSVTKVLDGLRQAIQSTPGPALRFLSSESDPVDLDLRSAVNAWKALKWLMPALNAAIEFRKELTMAEAEPIDFAPWLDTLKTRLSEGWIRELFEDVAPHQHVFQLLKNFKYFKYNELLCPEDPGQRRWHCVRDRNCAVEALQLENSSRESDVASTDYLLSQMSRSDAEFARFLEGSPPELCQGSKDSTVTPWTEFVSLRRWNSFSPNLASRATTTVGGGYLVRVWNKTSASYVGIAIDPGYNYLENLFDEGFTLPDLHMIVVTHAHPDHVENLSNILTLLLERAKRIRRTSRIFLVLTDGVFQRFKTLIDSEMDFIHDVVVLSWASRAKPDAVHVVGQSSKEKPALLRMGNELSPLVSIHAVPAIHQDGTEYDSMGVVLRVKGQDEQPNLSVGFTGDTRYTHDLCTKGGFADCDILVPHLGSVISNKAFCNLHESWSIPARQQRLKQAVDELQPTLTEKNHLYLPGILMLLCDIKNNATVKPPLIVLSEFGEELRGGLRVDLANRLHRIFGMTVLPADVGLRVGVEDRSVRCAVCRQYVLAEDVQPLAVSDEDEALVFVCNDCYRARQHELPMLLSRLRNTPQGLHPMNEFGSPKGSGSGKDRPEADQPPPKQS